jgi:hypothetical protein
MENAREEEYFHLFAFHFSLNFLLIKSHTHITNNNDDFNNIITTTAKHVEK